MYVVLPACLKWPCTSCDQETPWSCFVYNCYVYKNRNVTSGSCFALIHSLGSIQERRTWINSLKTVSPDVASSDLIRTTFEYACSSESERMLKMTSLYAGYDANASTINGGINLSSTHLACRLNWNSCEYSISL